MEQNNKTNQTLQAILAAICVMIVVLVITALICGLGIWSITNAEITTRHQFEATQKSIELIYDELWKTIAQQYEIATTERETFNKAMTDILKSERGVVGNGQLVSYLKQSKIDIPQDLFKTLMTTVEAKRESFRAQQMKLLQLKAQHDNLLDGPISQFIVGYKPRLEVHLITSEQTEKAIQSGQENDIKRAK